MTSKTTTISNFGSFVHVTGTGEEISKQERVMRARAEFAAKYCREKGWPAPGEPGFETMPLDHVLEIQDQPEWLHPLGEGEVDV